MILAGSMRPGPKAGVNLLARVVHRVWESNQSVRSQEDFELGAITLRLLSSLYEESRGPVENWQWPEGARYGSLSRKVTNGSSMMTLTPLDWATVKAFGCLFAVWQERNLERKSKLAWELSDAMEPTSGVRRQAEGGRKVYSLSEHKRPSEHQPVRKVSHDTEEAV